jgi:hypothetical protein
MKLNRKSKTSALNNIGDSMLVKEVEALLAHDEVFISNQRMLLARFASGALSKAMYTNLNAWMVGDVIRKAGRPLSTTRSYLKLTTH